MQIKVMYITDFISQFYLNLRVFCEPDISFCATHTFCIIFRGRHPFFAASFLTSQNICRLTVQLVSLCWIQESKRKNHNRCERQKLENGYSMLAWFVPIVTLDLPCEGTGVTGIGDGGTVEYGGSVGPGFGLQLHKGHEFSNPTEKSISQSTEHLQ